MGKLMQNTQIKHSSHPHLLQLSSNNLQNQAPITCNGCNLHISPSDHIFTCSPCNYFLHASCSKFPELITHPAHREHALTLLPTPIYPGGFFRCDACATHGTRFSYHCQVCDFDLHVLCASKALSVSHPLHAHPLGLTFSSPYGEKIGFSCDVCRCVGSCDQWLYRCGSCEFDAHLHCATAKMPVPSNSPAPSLQHNHSFPGAASNQFMATVNGQPLLHSMSTGHVQTYLQPQPQLVGGQGFQQPQPQPVAGQGFQQPQPVAGQGFQQPQPQPVAGQGFQQPQPQPIGAQGFQQPQPQLVGAQGFQQPQPQPQPIGGQGYQQGPTQPAMANQNVVPDNGMGNVIMTGFVDGMMQQLGQNFVQSLTDGGNGSGSGGGDVVNIDYQCTTVNENYENSENYETYDN